MDKVTWVKNFALCKELEIAGKFIYDGMQDLNSMLNYCDDEHIFCFLYKISVGIERLQKITYTLLKNPSEEEYENFEKELITPSHGELQKKIKELSGIDFMPTHNSFIQMLDIFYKSYRYDRYILNTDLYGERNLFAQYITENLNKDDISIDPPFVTPVENSTKKYLGKIIGLIAQSYYELIHEKSNELNIYAYELNSCSKSMKIFHNNCNERNIQQQFVDEQIALKELLIFIVNTKDTSGFYDFLKEIPPLDIDINMVQEYIWEILKGNIPQTLIDEVDFLYSETKDFKIKDRIEMLGCIGNPYCYFDDYDEDDIES